MAFHALIAVPLLDERPGGPRAGAGPVAPVPPKTRSAREFNIRTPAHVVPACQWPSAQPRARLLWAWAQHVPTRDQAAPFRPGAAPGGFLALVRPRRGALA